MVVVFVISVVARHETWTAHADNVCVRVRELIYLVYRDNRHLLCGCYITNSIAKHFYLECRVN